MPLQTRSLTSDEAKRVHWQDFNPKTPVDAPLAKIAYGLSLRTFETGAIRPEIAALAKPDREFLEAVATVAMGAKNFMSWQEVLVGSDTSGLSYHESGSYSARARHDEPGFDHQARFLPVPPEDGPEAFHPRELFARLAIAVAPFNKTVDEIPQTLREIASRTRKPYIGFVSRSVEGFAALESDPSSWERLRDYVPASEVTGSYSSTTWTNKVIGRLEADTRRDPSGGVTHAAMNRVMHATSHENPRLAALKFVAPPPAPAPVLLDPATAMQVARGVPVSGPVPREYDVETLVDAARTLRAGAATLPLITGNRSNTTTWGGERVTAAQLRLLAVNLEKHALDLGATPADFA